jgi:anti-sigma factor RsiW
MEMNCREFVELVTEFLDGALGDLVQRRFLQHLEACTGCERYLDELRNTISAVRCLPPEPLSDGERERLLTAFRQWRTS